MSRVHLFRVALVACIVLAAPPTAPADTVILKNGTIYKGTVDRDNTLVFVSDNLRRVIFYNSKIDKVVSDTGFAKFEGFEINQPIELHGGAMPTVAINIQSSPWDSKGRRTFRYLNARQQPVVMQQAINELRPYMVRFRGIDGFWVSQIATSQAPRPVVLGLLGRVNQADQEQRLKVARWLIQAEWYPEARVALDGLDRDFPDLKAAVADTRRAVIDLESREVLKEVALRRRANQPREALARLRALNPADLPKDVDDDVREQIRRDDDLGVSDRILADSLRELAEKLPEPDRRAWKSRLAEVLKGLVEAPEAARARLDALVRADTADAPASRFARAMSGWVAGPEAAGTELKSADDLWRARAAVRNYLVGKETEEIRRGENGGIVEKSKAGGDPRRKEDAPRTDPEKVRNEALEVLQALEKDGSANLDQVARIVARLEPPLRESDAKHEAPGVVRLHRVADDENPVPSEYALLLPPEYSPLRSYPAVVALHDGRGPSAAVEWVAAEAARRGYIVIAPEYNVPGQPRGYRYTDAEHAAAILSLRDARKRYAIDSDRVFVAGQLAGGDMAWDLGVAHPDLFAGVVSISGFPGKYVYRYRTQVDRVPLYIALGELAPAAREMVFDQFVKPMILDVQDVTYVDYLKRGLEALPEEVPSFFDWMDRRRRDPAPKSFDAATAREGDDRFFGVIVREIAPGRATAPEAADPLGKNLKPATIRMRSSVQGNLINLTTSGINRLDVWVSPRLIDFKRKLEVRLNEKPLFKGPVKLEFAPMLEDLRIRGDRQQLYYYKVTMGTPKPRGR